MYETLPKVSSPRWTPGFSLESLKDASFTSQSSFCDFTADGKQSWSGDLNNGPDLPEAVTGREKAEDWSEETIRHQCLWIIT